MSDNVVVKLPTSLNALADDIRTAYAQRKRGREDWIEGTIKLALKLCEARDRFPSDTAFGHWLVDNGLEELGENSRAALIAMAKEPEHLRDALIEQESELEPDTIWRKVKHRFGKFPKPTDSSINPPETHAKPFTTPISPVSDSQTSTETSSIKPRRYPILSASGKPIQDLSKTALAKTFGLSTEDTRALLSAYNSARRGALSAEILKLHANHNTRKRARDLIHLALEVAKAAEAPDLKKVAMLDARMFWPHLPDGFCAYLDMSANNLARKFDRLVMVNAKAAEMKGASPHDTANEINHIWAHGTARPKPVQKPLIIPPESKIKHEVRFCGVRIWPADNLKRVTDADLNTGWHLVHHWINYLENARPQKPNEIAVEIAHLIQDISEATSKEGLVEAMRSCLAAFVKVNTNALRADLSNSMAPGLKI